MSDVEDDAVVRMLLEHRKLTEDLKINTYNLESVHPNWKAQQIFLGKKTGFFVGIIFPFLIIFALIGLGTIAFPALMLGIFEAPTFTKILVFICSYFSVLAIESLMVNPIMILGNLFYFKKVENELITLRALKKQLDKNQDDIITQEDDAL